ncbi:MAG: hypothetical protein WC435_02755 [Candidatus Paceibacterota bacterium]
MKNRASRHHFLNLFFASYVSFYFLEKRSDNKEVVCDNFFKEIKRGLITNSAKGEQAAFQSHF